MLDKKENKVKVLRKSKILSLQAVNQVSCSDFLNKNDEIIKVKIEKMDYYLGI